MPKLLLIDNGKARHVEMGQELTLGRAYSNLLRLDSEDISRVHAIIYRRGDDYILRDLDSKNGVLLNGQRVANALLGPGDEVQLGPHLLVFDPPHDFDLPALLRKHGASVDHQTPTPDTPEMESSIVFARAAETPIRGRAVAPEGADGGKVFYNKGDVQKLLDAQLTYEGAGAGGCLLKLMGALHARPHFEGRDADTFPQMLLEAVVEAFGAERGVIVYKNSSGALDLVAIVPLDKDVAVNRVVMRAVFKEDMSVLCADALHDATFNTTETVKNDRIGSMLASPVSQADKVVGLIYLDVIERENLFRVDHLLALDFVARLLAMTHTPHKVVSA